ncbi:MAG: 16S rRNA (cytidine(1402)-2'-O)-methyltransferase [Rickettsiales bacterium]|jgi:16S rRNA (cytidine1402-2'-O)-methyltransferase|nr:16S rRNA (cytidine(1402)-2'-O)-methyltransferase [Rickettsiales bacterium]
MQEVFGKMEKVVLERALYVVATPIGNMGDATLRMVQILKSCGHLFCEDSRVSRKLLEFYDLGERHLEIYNDNSDDRQRDYIVNLLEKGNSVALLCDAGTPTISDPGLKLKQRCRNSGLKIIPVPGASACIAAISASCLGSDRFFFRGFLPSPLEKRKQELEELMARNETVICYESPLRLISTLKIIADFDDNKMICVARELTKMFEDIRTEKAGEMLVYYENKFAGGRVKGEIVLLLEKNSRPRGLDLNDLDSILKTSLKYLSLKNSAEFFSEALGLGKKEVYNKLLLLGERHE